MMIQPIDPNLNIIRNGLVFWLDPKMQTSYAGSGTAWNDLSGNDYDGTLINGPTFDSSEGGSIKFDGSNDYADFSASAIPSGNEITFSIWYEGFSPSLASSAFSSVNSNGGREINVHLPWSDNTLYFDCGSNGGGSDWDRISKLMAVSERTGWNNWVFWKNASTGIMKIYKNGTQWHSGTGKTKPLGTSTYFQLGRFSNANSNYDNGGIGAIHIYDRGLSDTEITHNYNAQKVRFGL